jgi:hypothetical protein
MPTMTTLDTRVESDFVSICERLAVRPYSVLGSVLGSTESQPVRVRLEVTRFGRRRLADVVVSADAVELDGRGRGHWTVHWEPEAGARVAPGHVTIWINALRSPEAGPTELSASVETNERVHGRRRRLAGVAHHYLAELARVLESGDASSARR